MSDLGKAYVQIIPSAEGISEKIKNAIGNSIGNEGDDQGFRFGSSFADAAKKIIIASGIGKIIGDALHEGGSLEQSIGGIETLFGRGGAKSVQEYAANVGKSVADVSEEYMHLKEAEELALGNAREAFRTTGLSANEYMQNISGFAASLNQSLGGDTVESARVANMAMIDMADNANKMGTSMESIQNAYQGFAKQNYTMLDNLKLGYGGTKTEMERLLKDAQQISGVKYDISNLADVYDAIHVIQEEVGIAGTTAKEASETLEGSANSMKAAWSDLLGNIATGGDVSTALSNLTQTVGTYLFGNLLPMIGNILSEVPNVIVGAVQGIAEYADEIVNTGVSLIGNLISGIVTAVPQLLEAMGSLVQNILEAIMNVDWIGLGQQIIDSFNSGAFSNFPLVISNIRELLSQMLASITENLPGFLSEGVEIIGNMAQGVFSAIPDIVRTMGDVINELLSFILENLPEFLDKGMEIISNIGQGFMDNLPEITASIGEVIGNVIKTIGNSLPEFIAKGFEIIINIITGFFRALPDLLGAVGDIVGDAAEAFFSIDWLEIGANIVNGIVDGIVSIGGAIGDTLLGFARDAWNGAKAFFGISSPSKLMRDTIGRYIPEGMAVGIETNADYVFDAMEDIADRAAELPIDMRTSPGQIYPAMDPERNEFNYGGQVFNIYASDYSNSREIAEAIREMLVNGINEENEVYA